MTTTPNNGYSEPRNGIDHEASSESNTERNSQAGSTHDDMFQFSGMELRPVRELGDRTKSSDVASEHLSRLESAESWSVPVTPSTPNPQQPDLAAPSGVAGAMVGLLLGGPIFGAIAGFGTAYAVRKEGSTGEVARALGELALSVKATGEEWEEKHHLLDTTKRAIDQTDSDLATKAKALMTTSWKAAVELNQEYNILDRGVETTGKGLEYVAEKLQSLSKEKSSQDNHN